MLGSIRKRLSPRVNRLNGYFLAAVNAHVLKGDEGAALAAFLAAAEAPSAQRNEMIAYLGELSDQIPDDATAPFGEPDGVQPRRVIAARIDMLYSRIIAGKWGRLDVESAKRQLRLLGSDYAEAHARADAEIFVQKYPDLPVFSETA